MQDISREFTDAARQLCGKELREAKPTLYRASSAVGCARKEVLDIRNPKPIGPNQLSIFRGGKIAEDIFHQLAQRAGYDLYFPQGKQSGPHDPPDFVWTWGDKSKEEFAVIHLDGVLCDKANDTWGILEVKNQDKYSFDKTCKEGPKDVYLAQMTTGVLGWEESMQYGENPNLPGCSQIPEFILFAVRNNSVKTNFRVDDERPDYSDVFRVYRFDRRDIDAMVAENKPLILQHFRTKSHAFRTGTIPSIPETIFGDRPGKRHWLCRDYCSQREECGIFSEVDERT